MRLQRLLVFSLLFITGVSGLAVDVAKKQGSDGVHINVDGQQKSNDSSQINFFNFNVFGGCCGGSGKDTTSNATTAAPESLDMRLRFEPWIMVLTGHHGNSYKDGAEILSLDEENHPVPQCLRSIKPFPQKLEGSVGESVQDGKRPLVCGGAINPPSTGPAVIDQCYTYDPLKDDWTSAGTTRVKRGRGRSSLHPIRGLIVSGGISSGTYGTSPAFLATVESTADGLGFRLDYAPMPVAVDLHCQLRIDDDTIFVAGGRLNTTQGSDRAFLFDISANIWTELPKMSIPREGAGCGVVLDAATGLAKQVVMAGGRNLGGGSAPKVDTVEVYDLKTKKWAAGTSLPVALSWPYSAPHRNAFVIVGGQANVDLDTIYEYDPEGNGGAGSWILHPNRIRSIRHEPTAFKVRKDIFPKC